MPLPAPSSARSRFATTRWTLVHEAAHGGDTAAAEALGALFSTYWPPLYRYARRRGKSREDAEDLVQGFFTHLVADQALRETDRGRGRFRAWMLAAFQHWMINDWKHAARQKRGGGLTPLSFDWVSAETGLGLDPVADPAAGPDRLFDREWALALLAKVLDELEAACRAEGGERQFALLRSCLDLDSSRIAYAELAAALDLPEGAVRVAVHRLRKRYRALLDTEIARTLAPAASVEEELRALLAALAG